MCGLAAMTMIPDVMRLPLTFSLSGALHAAVLSGFVPPPPPTGLPSPPIQVRLFDERPAQVAGLIPSGIPDTRTAPALNSKLPQDRHASVVLSAHAPATTPAVDPPAVAVATPVAEAAPLSEIVRGQVRHSEPLDSAAPPSQGTSVLSPSALASAAVIGNLPGSSDGDPPKTPDVSAGTLAAPYRAPQALHSPAPEYPEEARWEKRTGLATLGFRVEADGSVDEVRMLHSSGHADLDAAAVESLRHWRFVLPTGGAPASWYRYLFRFELT